MKIVSHKLIDQWYQAEYDHAGDDAIYETASRQLQNYYAILRKNKATVARVLDLGCGEGRSLIELARDGFDVTGIDRFGKDTAERRATKENLAIRFIEADITSFPFEKERYDAIIVSEVFHLMPRDKVENIIRRVISATNCGGFVYVSILSSLKRTFLASGEEFGYEDQSDYSSDEANRLLKERFGAWNILDLVTFHDELDWPINPGKHPIEPYHWCCDYVCMIARK